MPWIEKHRPKYLSEIKGQTTVVEKIKEFLLNFPARKKACLLSGPPGIGKTTIALAAAKEINAELFELNASDLRNKKKLQEILNPAIKQQSLVKNRKVILVDEVDGISTVDRGGLQELLTIIELTSHPIIITANDAWDRRLAKLRAKAEHLQLKEIDYRTIKETLIEILRKENKFLPNEVLTKIAVNAKGDLRAAINDAQAASKMKDPSKIEFSERNKEVDIFNAMKNVLQPMPSNETLKIFDNVKLHTDDIILWMEKNIPEEYSGKELERAFDLLSKTDVFRGRIYKQQYWRFLLYENIFLSYGISASKKVPKTGFTKYQKPTRILKIWMNNQRTAKKKSIAIKYAQIVHVGQKRAMHEFPIIKQIIKSNPQIAKELKLTEEEMEYLKG